MAKKQQKPEFPEETRICGIIFVMQMVAILSAVSIVYLTVASYTPSYRAIISSFEETSVICTTVLADDSVENCTWLSCFEWCLTKSSGLCMQIWVSVRNNGSELNFEQCNDRVEKSCTNEEFIPTHRHICRKDQCENLVGPCPEIISFENIQTVNLHKMQIPGSNSSMKRSRIQTDRIVSLVTGLFNCTKGTCVNVTAALNCTKFTSMDPQVSCKRRENCQHLDGFYTCAEGFCMRVLEPYTCERHCTEMDAKGKNLVLFSGDRIIMGNCLNAMERATQDLVWDPRTSRDVLFVSCSQVSNTSTGGLAAFDCVNASLVDPNALKNSLNLSQLMTVYHDPTVSHRLPPLNGYHVPLEQELTIYNRSRLLVNLEVGSLFHQSIILPKSSTAST